MIEFATLILGIAVGWLTGRRSHRSLVFHVRKDSDDRYRYSLPGSDGKACAISARSYSSVDELKLDVRSDFGTRRQTFKE